MRLPHLVFLLLAGCAGGPADQPGHRLEKTPAAAALYAHFATLLPVPGTTAADLIAWLENTLAAAALPPVDARPFDFAALADDAARQWTGKFNPVPLQPADFAALYRRALAV